MMTGKAYLIWFLSVVAGSVVLIVVFNFFADRIILAAPAGKSIQTVSGFERVIKPAWLDSIKPELVFVGSSQMREGFDPALIDPALGVRSFNYGISSATAYEVRRLFQDAAAQPSVKSIVAAMDSFYTGTAPQPYGGGFDELRLAVQRDGTPTPRRELWLFTTRYLSGGALGMHGFGLYLLAQLRRGQPAADRPDLFTAYAPMDRRTFAHDMTNRQERRIAVTTWQRSQWRAALGAICHRSDLHAYLFFSPSTFILIDIYMRNGADGVLAFKHMVFDDVQRHNASCVGKATLFDFMYLNALTRERADPKTGRFANYGDLVHFRPAVGARLLKRMLGRPEPQDRTLGIDVTNMGPANADAWFEHLRSDVLTWGSQPSGNR
jgi:hypothetical protein